MANDQDDDSNDYILILGLPNTLHTSSYLCTSSYQLCQDGHNHNITIIINNNSN